MTLDPRTTDATDATDVTSAPGPAVPAGPVAAGAGAGGAGGRAPVPLRSADTATTADEVAALVLAVPGVVSLHPGRFGEVATYLPGRRVAGVKLNEHVAEVHVVLAHGEAIQAAAQAIHAVVAAVVQVPVQVFVEDLATA